ncbi:hypothetical protein [Streptomyces sp. LaBMicrA B280]|uniref:hypothetical protein n=1 Tax=Streptomyces sp. LaBMicrA B280 TaxID=3391001 RepID=UPI003BA72A5E
MAGSHADRPAALSASPPLNRRVPSLKNCPDGPSNEASSTAVVAHHGSPWAVRVESKIRAPGRMTSSSSPRPATAILMESIQVMGRSQ